jgi:integrase
VRVRTSKSGKPRHVVLPQEGRDFIAGLAAGKPGSARLFLRSNGKPWAKSEQQRPLAAACKAALIDPPVNFHGLRHTYASRLAMRKVPLAVIAAQLGHSDMRMVEKHYGHLSPGYGSCPRPWCRSGYPEQRWLLDQAATVGRLTMGASLSGVMVSRLM